MDGNVLTRETIRSVHVAVSAAESATRVRSGHRKRHLNATIER
jgi:hypothetical protein